MSTVNKVNLVRRDDIPSMRTVVVDGVEHWLGHVKDFTKHSTLVNFLPKDNRISMAWVRLEAGEQLDEHIHPVESMILLCEGSAETLGDVQAPMQAGDVLVVPPGKEHGFIGGQPNGFWGLSLQFDSRGLYEDIDDPWASFDEYSEVDYSKIDDPAELLFKKNEYFMERFDKHRLFALVRKGLIKRPAQKSRFLDCFQVWSNYFQKMVISRVLNTQDPCHEALAWDHFMEELGHNKDLSESRDNATTVFDPVLESSSAWFQNIIPSLSDLEKVVLVHLVVEASATFFYKHVKPAMDGTASSEHFTAHNIDDHEHVQMGYQFIRETPITDVKPLLDIQEKGWAMLSVVMGRIADLVVHYSADDDASEKLETAEQTKVVEEAELETA
ncbi:cupin domain-containing protein [Teredinibacter sp. KSP-S5-2]|uniref:cupin domain-containing protein n=1 Tax=Teredinibacter sp. KSP-S5-2 TaxID=3034506 RepID=UPI002934865A|nr:cupin domain-containing protein [Teredinibacter sp. KSP-S5-2]WNO10752.1 cupin domain-containing protein [Teredinibacter sp. KSP-S5-2]